MFRNDDERERAARCGITSLDRKYEILDTKGNVMFAATGVTDGTMLRGVRFSAHGADPVDGYAIVGGTVRVIEATHNFDRKRPGIWTTHDSDSGEVVRHRTFTYGQR